MPLILTTDTNPGTAQWSSVSAECVCIAGGEVTGFDASTTAIVAIADPLEANDRFFISPQPTGAAYPVDGGGNPVVFAIGGTPGESQVRIVASAVAAAPATVNFQVFRALT